MINKIRALKTDSYYSLSFSKIEIEIILKCMLEQPAKTVYGPLESLSQQLSNWIKTEELNESVLHELKG